MAIGLCAVALMVAWHDGLVHLARTWLGSEAYHHGVLVAPASVMLIVMGWRSGEGLHCWPKALIGVGIAAVVFFAGRWLEARLLQHAAVPVMVISLFAFLAGPAASQRHRFALGFLLFMVPIGNSLIPVLQDITAQGIMPVIGLFGIDAIRIDTLIRTLVGDFNVAEACSGLRFLLANVVSGVLIAHLFFTSKKKQGIFLGVALVLPVLANIVRASVTIIVATKSNLELAVGVDHLIYGWVFFAVMLVILLGLGFIFADDQAPILPTPDLTPAKAPPLGLLGVAIILILSAGII